MTLHQLSLIAFGAGCLIHGIQSALVARLWRQTQGARPIDVQAGLRICLLAFFWQFGNFFWELTATGGFIRASALVLFPLLFSYIIDDAGWFGRANRVFRYALWPWSILALIQVTFPNSPADLGLGPGLTVQTTLYLMLLYFVAFSVRGWLRRRSIPANGPAAVRRANQAGVIAALLGSAMFILMLGSRDLIRPDWVSYINLAAMMTSVPFTIAIAYHMYELPFMDAFVREALSGVILLSTFVIVLAATAPLQQPDMLVILTMIFAMALAYAKEPVTRWVEQSLMGYSGSVEEQEERIGTAIRGLTQMDEFASQVSEIVRVELDADWVRIEPAPVPGAACHFEIPGLSAMFLSLGPRAGGRRYMSRHLRVSRTAALQLATHLQQLSHHELRGTTARAQMKALQAQINPHFLFNTLNVLASLIHTNPAKAERVTEELAEIFRYALESTRMEWVKLEDELHFLESYLEIEKARFEERLVFRFDVDPKAGSLLVPAMILQPLVENAVIHGISPKVEGGEVRVAARIEGERLIVTVEDTGAGMRNRSRQGGTGIGLSNVRERLNHLYGDESVLQIEDLVPAGTRVSLALPLFKGVPS